MHPPAGLLYDITVGTQWNIHSKVH